MRLGASQRLFFLILSNDERYMACIYLYLDSFILFIHRVNGLVRKIRKDQFTKMDYI